MSITSPAASSRHIRRQWKTTTRYAHVLDEEVAAAMELLQNAREVPKKVQN
ncbi:hypothetical protein [Mesorhizobium sp. M5C.F.Ca.IN.020.29.1.1]|uniref:hypothetical protein n=1 Tax=Mesorhizobium sp. M5C.F.Ca.IN.020.29.1.1 TaxID=2496770 RepID=UPI0019D1442D|nr:hypothetical protein [Mesorhizobium sp. M5C.F.Ca.IN.020.29.1.1]